MHPSGCRHLTYLHPDNLNMHQEDMKMLLSPTLIHNKSFINQHISWNGFGNHNPNLMIIKIHCT